MSPGLDSALAHPYFKRSEPETLLIDDVERIWAPIAEEDDWAPFTQCLDRVDEMRDAYRPLLGEPERVKVFGES